VKNSFSLRVEFSAKPETVFKTWLSSRGHSAMTGSPARVEPRVGGTFTAWDGYITGKTLELKPYSRIVQSWRTSEFADSDPDSSLEIDLEAVGNGTRLTLTHSNIPAGQVESYKEGWEDSYFSPMREYLNKQHADKEAS
jgi:activator of HSP90 ATPase